jgi:hypothetical protein
MHESHREKLAIGGKFSIPSASPCKKLDSLTVQKCHDTKRPFLEEYGFWG